MEANVEDLGGLKRKISVEVPLDEVAATYESVYAQIKGNVRVDGFRPGKYPRHLAEKRFKDVMAQEALRTLVPKYYEQVLEEKQIHPATEPKFDNLDIDQKRPFKFDVAFEVIPEFDLPDVAAFKLEEPKVKVTKASIEERIEQLRSSRATPEEKDGPAEKGDMVTFDFEGTRDGEVFEGGSGQGQTLEIGGGRFLEDFETNLTGMAAGEEKTFDVTFPGDYGEPSLQNATVQFKVNVSKVHGKKPPPLDAEFFKQFGESEDEAAFRTWVEDELKQEQQREADQKLRDTVAEQIRETTSFAVPGEIVERALHEFEHQLERQEPEALKDAEALEKRKAEERTRQEGNLRTAYALDRFAQEHNVEVNPEEVRNQFFFQAYMMQQNPEELMRSEYGSMMVRQIHEGMMHQKTLELLVNRILGREPEPAPEAKAAADATPAAAAEAAPAEAPEGDLPSTPPDETA